MKRSKILILMAASMILIAAGCAKANKIPSEVTMSKQVLEDKIHGAWAGQTIGCTYGGPTEFKFHGMISDEVMIPWDDLRVKWYFDNAPGLYDDVYMDLTFVEVFQKEGLDAPIESFANAFANAEYPLWHANKQARYNILRGVMPPASGHWENNPHADDIDFQIEADYAGIMSPGMPNAASHYADGIGHMMNYGDGWYGGVYVANMYALAFVCDDVETVVEEALKSIPAESKFYKGMADVIKWYRQYPDNWEITWALFNRKYGYDVGCPDGVDVSFNIDAVINSGYILIGLLYGEKDFFKTIDIATRCGQDSDCNPASAGGILATMTGYSGIPEFWRRSLDAVKDRPFSYTDVSIEKATEYSLSQALQVIERNGGEVLDDEVKIKVQKPEAVRFEQGFANHWPKEKVTVKKTVTGIDKIEFEGNGIVIKHHFYKNADYVSHDYTGQVEVYIDGNLDMLMEIPANRNGHGQSAELYWKYNLPEGKHTVTFKFLNKEENMNYVIDSYLVYSSNERSTVHGE